MVERIGLTNQEFPERSSDQILRDIALNREAISKTADHLGHRIEDALDWRSHVARHPYVAVAVAAGFGMWCSRFFRPRVTPAGRVFTALHQTAAEVAHRLRESSEPNAADKPEPMGLTALFGAAVARAGIDFLSGRVNDLLQARETPNDGPHPRSNGAFKGARQAPDHEGPLSKTGLGANHH